jgi:hypothetical protein
MAIDVADLPDDDDALKRIVATMAQDAATARITEWGFLLKRKQDPTTRRNSDRGTIGGREVSGLTVPMPARMRSVTARADKFRQHGQRTTISSSPLLQIF